MIGLLQVMGELSNTKESHLPWIVEFAIAMGVEHEHSLNWWVPHILKKHDSIIAKVQDQNAWYLKHTFKVGTKFSKNVEDTLVLEEESSALYVGRWYYWQLDIVC